MSEGWRCPTCGQVYAPWVSKCGTCPNNFGYSTSAVPTNPKTCGGCGKYPCDGSTSECDGTFTLPGSVVP